MNFGTESPIDGGNRRDLLAAAGMALLGGLAGCLGAFEDDGDETDPTGDERESTESAGSTAALRERLADADPYRMHQYGPAHAGAAPGRGPTADVDAAWTFREGADDSLYGIGPPAVVDGTVYVAEGHSVGDGAETVVYALDGATGEIEWEWPYPGTNSFGATVVAEGAVVVSIGTSVVALEADSGTDRWRVDRDFSDPLTVADGTVYAIDTTYADPPTLVAIDLETGRERWTAALADGRPNWPTPPAVADGTVYQGGLELVALSAADGERRWSRDLEHAITGAPTVVDDGLYVPVGDGTVAAFDRDGSRRWRQSVDRAGRGSGLEPVTSPAAADGTLYVTNSWQLTALEVGTGTERWTTEVGGSDPPIVADGVVYVSGLNTMEAYDCTDGTLLWRYRSDATSASGDRIAPVAGGTVFYPSAGLHALRGTDESPD
ncbi:PQQ-binding-like beta-propeller repeat protein [Natrinema salaciae]|uniref:Outer membrane protein assembly factor BamB, contains PQQ-like beta-propeller repeat n=1 Tax=Natrinema salaciae TaxID=1186196 RepID=A0A1H9G7F7_9EURY|nr:PQQ-binding-like beta-propeller repeat protein [Natrinema salaciae]SEQ46009.1 Outer membrane protein assembly factor BamB, contains PQQ-like beta-propeller repeat [Natrinema salaciae]